MKKLIYLLIPYILFAFVNVHVNKKTVYPGEEVIFTIEASGNDIKFPDIKDIDGFTVQGTAITKNITILNGNMQQSVSKSYIFFPTKTVTIPKFNIVVDNKTYTTEPIKITVTKPKETNNKDFKIKLSVNKKSAFIGEPVIFKIKFFQKENTSPQSIEIQKPNFKNFITRQISKKEYIKNNFDVTEYSFLLIAQKTGTYHIGPIMAKIGYLSRETPFNDPFFNLTTATLKYTNIFSNQVDLNVTSIPKNSVYGHFKADFSAEKTEVNANEPVNVTLNIKGCGDFYDLPDFKLNIKNATVYENAPKIKTFLKDNTLCGTYTKTFTLVSNRNITIPSINFKAFYNNKTYDVKTNKIFIKVKGGVKANTVPVVKEKIKEKIIYKKETNYILIALIYIIGIITGALIACTLRIKFASEASVIKKIKKANEKELFNILLEYSDNEKIEKYLKLLEENIYNGKNHNINKKEIIKIIKTLNK